MIRFLISLSEKPICRRVLLLLVMKSRVFGGHVVFFFLFVVSALMSFKIASNETAILEDATLYHE